MAYAVVQSNHTSNGGAAFNSIAYGASVTSSNLLVLSASFDGGVTTLAPTGCTSAWNKIGSQLNGATNQRVEFWYALASSGTTVSLGATIGGAAVAIAEFSGVATSTPLDVSDCTKTFAATTTATDHETSTAITPSGSGELVVGCYQGAQGVAPTITAGTGYTLVCAESGIASTTGATAIEWKTGSSGSTTATYTVNLSTDRYTVQIATFLAAGGGGGGTTEQPGLLTVGVGPL